MQTLQFPHLLPEYFKWYIELCLWMTLLSNSLSSLYNFQRNTLFVDCSCPARLSFAFPLKWLLAVVPFQKLDVELCQAWLGGSSIRTGVWAPQAWSAPILHKDQEAKATNIHTSEYKTNKQTSKRTWPGLTRGAAQKNCVWAPQAWSAPILHKEANATNKHTREYTTNKQKNRHN